MNIERMREGVYIIKGTGRFKVGQTSNIHQRMGTHLQAGPDLKLLWIVKEKEKGKRLSIESFIKTYFESLGYQKWTHTDEYFVGEATDEEIRDVELALKQQYPTKPLEVCMPHKKKTSKKAPIITIRGKNAKKTIKPRRAARTRT